MPTNRLRCAAASAPASRSITSAAGGQFSYTIACTGAGGTTARTVALSVPMAVRAISCKNKNDIAIAASTF